MKTSYVAAMDRLYLACIWVAGTAITCMSLIIPWGVFTRYVMGTGSQWPEPIAILLMMVFTFIGAAAGYRANAHIAVTMLTDVMPAPIRAACGWLVDSLMALACAFVVWYGTHLCLGTMGQSISELPWLPVGVTYAALPIGSLITLLFVLERRWIGPQDQRRLMRYEESDEAFAKHSSEAA
ncbi:TRAP transporter small permease [Hydrogenophaga sp.]|uniref:TRAP transporter small permease n=1 Tax=Hydrogenophaga sp. TaxID=1904254 RepID=UPI00260FCFAD|nr:TRAP transporter small permease [Hydrogenophaga sp.]MCW5652867.1 TRAP transporter small permease [Hydrogenophaga sp.]